MTRSCALLFALFIPPLAANPVPVSWSLAGTWRVQDANDGTPPSASGWRGLKVPANWYSAGYDHQARCGISTPLRYPFNRPT